MAKEAQIFTVKNDRGQFLGTYRALTAAQAIAAHKHTQALHFSTFRSHGAPRKPQSLTVTVEPRN